MSDKITCLNRGLAFLGERPITNPDSPETPAGKHLADQFDQCRREVLRRYPWNWAETWKACQITTAPPFGYTNAYSFPDDCLRLIWVGDITETRRDFRIINQGKPDYRKVIAIDNSGANTLNIAYTSDVTILSQWDPLALKVLSIWLALDAAKAVTGKVELVKMLNELLSDELKDAVGVDGQEQATLRYTTSYVQDERDLASFGSSLFTKVEGY